MAEMVAVGHEGERWMRVRRVVAAAILGLAGGMAGLMLAGLGYPGTGAALASERPALLRCSFAAKDNGPQAACDIGPAADLGRIQRVSWRKEGQTGTVDARYTPFAPSGKGAVLFLVNRGDKTRAKTVATITSDLIRLVDSARSTGAGIRVGLGTTTDRFDIPAPVGASREDIAKSISAIKADGVVGDAAALGTAAVQVLAGAADPRRLLVIVSDGRAEDASYGSDDLVALAQDQHVNVLALVYRDGGDAPGLVGVRRLVEETGGVLMETGPGARVDEGAISRFGQYLHSGGTATFPLDSRDPRGRYVVGVEIEGGARLSGTFSADLNAAPIAQPVAAPAAEVTRVQEAPVVAENAPGLAESSGFDRALQFLRKMANANRGLMELAGGLLVLLILVGWVSSYLRRRGIRAFIQIEDDPGTRIAIRADGIRLGRHSDNDIRFSERSVHRYHALLTRDPDTSRYVITDLSRDQARSNGVVVNSEIIKRAELAHGDLVELGEVRFRFLYNGKLSGKDVQ
jgi:hypothetical protein